MKLHSGQMGALQNLVAAVRIVRSSLAVLTSMELIDKLEEQILKAPPWKSLIGEAEFARIVWRTIFQVSGTIPSDYEGMLSDFGDGSGLNTLLHALRTQFESLPRKYDIFIPMGSVQELQRDEIKITENVAVADASHNDYLRGLISAGIENSPLYRALSNRPLLPKSIDAIRYLRVSGGGYADDSPDSQLVRGAWSIAKQLVFVGMASGALISRADDLFRPREISSISNVPTLVVAQDESEEVFRTSPGFELGQLFHTIRFKQLKFLDFSKGLSLLSAEERDAATGDEIQRAVSRSMATSAAFLNLESPDIAPIRAAMEWFIDADASQNETIAFLQRCIGLEALLGSSESRRDVTERLADRYSYLVANTVSGRNIHRGKFVEMYRHRSEIVHGRSTTLSDKHRQANWDARNMLLQAAWREMHNVLKELQP